MSQLSEYLESMPQKIVMSYIYLGLVYDKSFTRPDGKLQQMNGYKVTLKHSGRSMQFPYRQGIGIGREPSLADVVHCICLDAQAGGQSFDEFCNDFGYNTDSKLHEQIYKQYRKMLTKVERVFGKELLNELSSQEH